MRVERRRVLVTGLAYICGKIHLAPKDRILSLDIIV
jgi:hypothetical protein